MSLVGNIAASIPRQSEGKLLNYSPLNEEVARPRSNVLIGEHEILARCLSTVFTSRQERATPPSCKGLKQSTQAVVLLPYRANLLWRLTFLHFDDVSPACLVIRLGRGGMGFFTPGDISPVVRKCRHSNTLRVRSRGRNCKAMAPLSERGSQDMTCASTHAYESSEVVRDMNLANAWAFMSKLFSSCQTVNLVECEPMHQSLLVEYALLPSTTNLSCTPKCHVLNFDDSQAGRCIHVDNFRDGNSAAAPESASC